MKQIKTDALLRKKRIQESEENRYTNQKKQIHESDKKQIRGSDKKAGKNGKTRCSRLFL